MTAPENFFLNVFVDEECKIKKEVEYVRCSLERLRNLERLRELRVLCTNGKARIQEMEMYFAEEETLLSKLNGGG